MDFRWNAWNVAHVGRHGVQPTEAEWIVSRHRASDAPDDKHLTEGQTVAGRFLRVIFVLDPDGTVYVIHARPMTLREKRAYRRRQR